MNKRLAANEMLFYKKMLKNTTEGTRKQRGSLKKKSKPKVGLYSESKRNNFLEPNERIDRAIKKNKQAANEKNQSASYQNKQAASYWKKQYAFYEKKQDSYLKYQQAS